MMAAGSDPAAVGSEGATVTLKVRLAAMMIGLIAAVMALQYLLLQREQTELSNRIGRLSREIDESTAAFSRWSLESGPHARVEAMLDELRRLEWIAAEAESTLLVVGERDSVTIEVEHRVPPAAQERRIVERLRHGGNGGDSTSVRILIAGRHLAPPSGDEKIEPLKINVPLPGDPDSPGEQVQLLYSFEDLTGELERSRRRSWYWLTGILGVGATGAVLLAVQFTRPIRSLESSFGRVVDGDLDVRVDPRRPDEIGKLTGSFNEMVARLRESRDMEKRLAESERLAAIGRLAAGVAHEVRNPLNAMRLTVQQLADKSAPPAGSAERERFDRYAAMIAAELSRLERLVSTFLDLSRSDEPARDPVDLAESLRASLALFESEAATGGVALTGTIEDALVIRGDRERLPTVWNNLISNALHATAAGGRIEVRAREAGQGIVVEVADDGAGIAPEALPHVWEPFWSGRADGAGLGLSLVRSIVERHGGDVAAESSPGRGTTIRVRFPRGEGEETA